MPAAAARSPSGTPARASASGRRPSSVASNPGSQRSRPSAWSVYRKSSPATRRTTPGEVSTVNGSARRGRRTSAILLEERDERRHEAGAEKAAEERVQGDAPEPPEAVRLPRMGEDVE